MSPRLQKPIAVGVMLVLLAGLVAGALHCDHHSGQGSPVGCAICASTHAPAVVEWPAPIVPVIVVTPEPTAESPLLAPQTVCRLSAAPRSPPALPEA